MIKTKARQKSPFPAPRVVEGTLTILDEPPAPASAPTRRSRRRRVLLRPCLLPLFAACLFSLTAVGYAFLWSRVTVTIVSATAVRTATISVVATTHPGSGEGRLVQYEARASSPFVPVHATGVRHSAPAAARGSLTWYNQQSYAQTIPAATRIAVSPTLQVAPDQDVVVPGGTGQAPGETSAPAHALQAGAAGDIAPGTVDMLCSCGAAQGILVKNPAAFSGGQDATTSRYIQPSDLTQAVASQEGPTRLHAQHLLLAQVRPPEQTGGESACTPSIVTDRPVTATGQVHASVRESCTVFAFNPDEARSKAIAIYRRSAITPGPHQVLTTVSASRRVQIAGRNGTQAALLLAVPITAQWRYVMGVAEQKKLLGLLAGKTPEEATQLLTHYMGVGTFTISQLVPWLAFPDDPGRIAIQCENPPGPREP